MFDYIYCQIFYYHTIANNSKDICKEIIVSSLRSKKIIVRLCIVRLHSPAYVVFFRRYCNLRSMTSFFFFQIPMHFCCMFFGEIFFIHLFFCDHFRATFWFGHDWFVYRKTTFRHVYLASIQNIVIFYF